MPIRSFAAALLLAGAIIQPASAATYLITYTGTVSSGVDSTGVFGTKWTNLAGNSFTVVYTLTSPQPGSETYSSGPTAYARGGSSSGTISPVSATITIKGITQTIDGSSFGQAYQFNDASDDSVSHVAQQYSLNETSYVNNTISSSVNNIVNSTDYTAALNYLGQADDYRSGSFQIERYYVAGNGDYVFTGLAYGNLISNSVTIAAVDAAPEPATWAMMIAGFGAVGGSLRRRSRMGAVQLA